MPTMRPETKASRYQRAIDELLRSGSRSSAAEHVGVSVGTIDRWHQDDRFLEMLVEARTEATKGITTRLWHALDDATATLTRNLRCGQPSAEIRSAVALFDIALRLAEATEVEERLQALEAAMAGVDRS